MTRGQKILLGCLAACHFVLLYLMLSRSLDFLFNDAAHRIGPGSDFWALYNAGKHWRLGDGIYMQGPGYGFRYHPILAMTVLAWLSFVKHQTAYWIWVVVHEVLLLAAAAHIRKLCTNHRHFLLIAAILVFFTPYYLEVYMGNASFITAALLLFAFHFYSTGGYRRFYFLYVAGVLIKPIGLLLLPILFVKRQYTMVVSIVVAVVGLALPYFLLHPGEWHHFLSVNFDGYPTNPGFLVHGGNQGFYALVTLVSSHASDISLTRLYSLTQLPLWNNLLIRAIPYLMILVAGVLTIRLRRGPHIHLLLFIWSATYLLGYKDVWEHSYCFLIFGLWHLYLSQRVNGRLLFIVTVALALPTAFALYDITFYRDTFNDPDWHWSFATSLIHHLTKPIWLLIAFMAAVFKGYSLPVNGPPDGLKDR